MIPCHANITNYKPGASCCLYIESGKTQFDKWDLQEYLQIKESKLYKLREKGERRATCVILLNKILNTLRERNQSKRPTKNVEEITNFINSSYLGLAEIGARLSDVEIIKNNLDFVQNYVEQAGHEFTLAELLGTEEPLP